MARMYPPNLDLLNPTYSERVIFEHLKNQLGDECSVFYSISWIDSLHGERKSSEVDFIIYDPKYGFLCMEVKGGSGIEIIEGEWYLILNNEEKRKLRRSPFEQAEASMRYFLDYYEKEYNIKYKGVFGAMVSFPLFEISDQATIGNRPRQSLITSSDLLNLNSKLKKAFVFFRNQNTIVTEEQKTNFLNLLNKRIVISASAGALINQKKQMLEQINRVQNNIIHFIENFNQFYIKGGAGTGKTWIGMKLALKYSACNLNVLIICFSDHLALFIKSNLDNENIEVRSLNSLVETYFGHSLDDIQKIDDFIINQVNHLEKFYDAIIVDESQDITEEWAFLIRCLLKNQKESYLCVLYDETQNVFKRDFKDAFMIQNPVFLLNENLRNTSSIYSYAVRVSKLGGDVITNPIVGPVPEYKKFASLDAIKRYLESVLCELILDEGVSEEAVVVIVDKSFISLFEGQLSSVWMLSRVPLLCKYIRLSTTEDFKGLESDVVIYIHEENSDDILNYVSLTRARFFLYDFELSSISN